MCGRYLVITEDEILEMRAILDELGKRFGGIDELPFPASFPSPAADSFPRHTEDSSVPSTPDTPFQLSFLPPPTDDANTLPLLQGKQGEVFPGTMTPVLVLDREDAVLKPMRWGFTRWDGKGAIINARAETVADKAMFRGPLHAGRCIIPSRGFFEWHRDAAASAGGSGRRPEKYRIRRKESMLFFMTGIYQVRDGVEEFAILTMPAMEEMQAVHDRMPVFAVHRQILDWLEDPGCLEDLLSNRHTLHGLDLLRV
jgi:putative SOS response-associated peptidase YedK